MDNLKQTDKWVIWKSKDKWSTSLQTVGFHQLLHIHQDIQDECWDLTSKEGDIQETFGSRSPRKSLSVGQETKERCHRGAQQPGVQESITTALLVSFHNFGKDEYVVDLEGHEARY